MSNFTTLSAIIRGQWLMDKSYADASMPLVVKMVQGENISFASPVEKTTKAVSMSSDMVCEVYPDDEIIVPSGTICLVEIEGPLLKHGGDCSFGMIDYAELITNLGNNSNVAGIIISIDSPGGQVNGTATLADAIKLVSAIKPVVAVVEDGMAASAAMWIASAANEIYATQKTDRFGSIGVYCTIADYYKQYKELMKLDVQDIYAPESVDKNKDYNDAIAGDPSAMKEQLSVLAQQFIGTIQTNRAGKIKGDSWATGKMFYATDAAKIGLIDGIKSMSEVVKRISTLSNNKAKTQKLSNMAFEKTLITAGAESFAVTDEGFVLSEENLNAIESELSAIDNVMADLVETKAALEAANSLISSQDSAIATHVEEKKILGSQLSAMMEEIATLGSLPSGDGTTLAPVAETEIVGTAKPLPAYMDPNHPMNQFADRRTSRK